MPPCVLVKMISPIELNGFSALFKFSGIKMQGEMLDILKYTLDSLGSLSIIIEPILYANNT